ncbi:odorant receptor 49a-like [Trichogramma pretiosum]|uniref:odorant receptor 49a-like n=1 Tax=Trichogramma pretiosum TaxID=7493 RepID=UPI0006C96225|nr:odorant receptor 49a-like [Trichogramma pretiosum]
MMEHVVRRYEKYKDGILFMLIVSGLWPNYDEHPEKLKIILSICSAVTTGGATLGMVYFCISNFTNVNVLTRGLGLMISYFSTFLKVIVLVYHKKNILKLSKGASAQFEEDLKTPANRPFLLAYFPTFSKFYYCFRYSVALNIFMMVLKPLLALRQGKYIRTYPVKIPFEYESGGLVHWIIYALEVAAGYYCWSVTVGVDTFFGFFTLHLVGELQLLSSRFADMKPDKNHRKIIKELVDRHNLLIEAQRTVQKIFGLLSVWLAITCAFIICAIIFQATETKNMTAYKAVYLLCYAFLKLVQAYSYAWYGHIITVESERCLNEMYNSTWPGLGDVRLMKDILFMQSQKPLIFKAKSCMIVQLDMFTKIIHTSASYFFLLQTLDEGQIENFK